MVTLEFQLSPSHQHYSATFREVDAVAALQQLSPQSHAARDRSPQAILDVVHSDSEYHQKKQPAPQSCRSQQTAVTGLSSGLTSTATTARNTPHVYANDGVRLSEQGEQLLFVGSPQSPVLQEQELSFSLPPELNASSSSNRMSGAVGHSSQPLRRKYVCSIKDDPLVKGRLAAVTEVSCSALRTENAV